MRSKLNGQVLLSFLAVTLIFQLQESTGQTIQSLPELARHSNQIALVRIIAGDAEPELTVVLVGTDEAFKVMLCNFEVVECYRSPEPTSYSSIQSTHLLTTVSLVVRCPILNQKSATQQEFPQPPR